MDVAVVSKKQRDALFTGDSARYPDLTCRQPFAILAAGLAPALYLISVAGPVFPPIRLAFFSYGSFKGVA
jgi:hypothetical protein